MKVLDLLKLQIKVIRIPVPEDTFEYINRNLGLVKARLQIEDKKNSPVAVVGYGPSLKDNWEELKNYKYIISTSGAHKFLIERGIIPTWHVDCDPRPHKAEFTKEPHKDVIYLIASSAHPLIVDNVKGYNVKLWNFDVRDRMSLPDGEYELPTYGDVGQQSIYIAKVLGFTEVHLFGFDYAFGQEGNHHSGSHGNELTVESVKVTVDRKIFWTTHGEFVKNLLYFDLVLLENPELIIEVHGNTLLSHYLGAKFG